MVMRWRRFEGESVKAMLSNPCWARLVRRGEVDMVRFGRKSLCGSGRDDRVVGELS